VTLGVLRQTEGKENKYPPKFQWWKEKIGFDDSSPGGLNFPSPWVPTKVFVPSQDTRKAKVSYNNVRQTRKLIFMSLIATITNDIYQQIKKTRAAK
jgi:hypothetical protein